MKKVLFFATAFAILAGILAGCGSGGLDFKSVRDTETGEIISLGDTKESVEKVLGTGVYDETFGEYNYLDGLVTVTYDSADQMMYITVEAETNRFEFKDMSFDMKNEDIAGRFTRSDDSDEELTIRYGKFYDSTGKVVDTEDLAAYGALIAVYGSETILSGEPGTIMYMGIAKNPDN